MKERPILFSAPMVRALLAGTKTQTRRLVKPQPIQQTGYPEPWAVNVGANRWQWKYKDCVDGVVSIYDSARDCALCNDCPYGMPGDRLWVKETHRFGIGWDKSKPTQIPAAATVRYEADGALRGEKQPIEAGKTRVSLFMRRLFSRLILEITNVRVERLNAISEADAVAEGVSASRSPDLLTVVDSTGKTCQITLNHVNGVPKPGEQWLGRTVTHVEPCPGALFATARDEYRTLWERLNGGGSWALNPWVWVITFRRVEA